MRTGTATLKDAVSEAMREWTSRISDTHYCLGSCLLYTSIGNLKVKTDSPSGYLRQILASYRSPRFDYLPSFTGGLVGYFSYDYLTYSEPAVKCDVEDTEAFKDVDLMLFDKVIAFDHLRQKIILIVNMPLDELETGYNLSLIHIL